MFLKLFSKYFYIRCFISGTYSQNYGMQKFRYICYTSWIRKQYFVCSILTLVISIVYVLSLLQTPCHDGKTHISLRCIIGVKYPKFYIKYTHFYWIGQYKEKMPKTMLTIHNFILTWVLLHNWSVLVSPMACGYLYYCLSQRDNSIWYVGCQIE